MPLASLMLLVNVRALPDVINFDDLDASGGDVVLDALSPYHGFTWTNFSVYTSTPGFPGYNNWDRLHGERRFTGGEAVGASVVPIVGSFSSATPFDFLPALETRDPLGLYSK